MGRVTKSGWGWSEGKKRSSQCDQVPMPDYTWKNKNTQKLKQNAFWSDTWKRLERKRGAWTARPCAIRGAGCYAFGWPNTLSIPARTDEQLSVPDNAQMRVYNAHISVLTRRCEACASCWRTDIFSDRDDQQANRKAKFRKRNHACQIRFLSAMLIGHFRKFCSKADWLKIYFLSPLSSQVCYLIKNTVVAKTNEQVLSREKFWHSCSVHLPSRFHATKTGLRGFSDRVATHYALFSFVLWTVGFDILHNVFTIRWIISRQQQLKILMFRLCIKSTQRCWASLQAVAAIPTIALTPPPLPPPTVVSHILSVQYFACPL